MEDISLCDAKRGLDIECRVHFPGQGDKLPLIVFSHGRRLHDHADRWCQG